MSIQRATVTQTQPGKRFVSVTDNLLFANLTSASQAAGAAKQNQSHRLLLDKDLKYISYASINLKYFSLLH